MKKRNSELMEMLEYLELFALEERFKAICDSPKFSSLDSVQLLQELVSAEYEGIAGAVGRAAETAPAKDATAKGRRYDSFDV